MGRIGSSLLPFGHRPRNGIFGAVCLFVFLSAMPVLGQTVRPLIDENVVKGPGKSASGRIEYYNDSLQPLTVTLEGKSFTVSETGDLSYRPLEDAIHVKFSEMSFRVDPKQNYFIYYQAYADKLPFLVCGLCHLRRVQTENRRRFSHPGPAAAHDLSASQAGRAKA